MSNHHSISKTTSDKAICRWADSVTICIKIPLAEDLSFRMIYGKSGSSRLERDDKMGQTIRLRDQHSLNDLRLMSKPIRR